MRQRFSYQSIFTIFAILLMCLAVGCGALTPATPTAQPHDAVKVQMGWTHEYSAAFLYTAELNHHFAENNLDVTLVEGGFVNGTYVEPIDEVMSGEVDFAEVSASGLLQARLENKPVVAIATIFQRNPTAIISLAESNIQTPQDLIGKTVAVNEGGATRLIHTMLVSQGITVDEVNIIPREGFGIEPLINGEVDALVGWIINEGILVREAGKEPSFMLMSDYGIADYNTLVIATEETINERPEMVQNFVRATVAGLQDVIANPEQAIDYTLQYNSELDREAQLNRLRAAIPLIQPARSHIAMMDPESWAQIESLLVEAEILADAVDPTTAYTLSFLNTIYNQQ